MKSKGKSVGSQISKWERKGRRWGYGDTNEEIGKHFFTKTSDNTMLS